MTWFSRISNDWGDRFNRSTINDCCIEGAIAWHFPIFYCSPFMMIRHMAYRGIIHANVHVSHWPVHQRSKIDYVNSNLIRCFNNASFLILHFWTNLCARKQTNKRTSEQTYAKSNKYRFLLDLFSQINFLFVLIRFDLYEAKCSQFFLNYYISNNFSLKSINCTQHSIFKRHVKKNTFKMIFKSSINRAMSFCLMIKRKMISIHNDSDVMMSFIYV